MQLVQNASETGRNSARLLERMCCVLAFHKHTAEFKDALVRSDLGAEIKMRGTVV